MSDARLKTVLVGFGKIGQAYAADEAMARYYRYATHAQVLADHPRFSWVAVVDPSPGAQDAARAAWNVRCAAGDVAGLGAVADEIEVAVIATPPSGRATLLDGFPRLRAVLVEKPLGRTVAEAQAFLDRCAARGIVVQVNLWRRADALFRALADGRLYDLVGPVQTATACYGNGLVNNGTHLVDFARMLFGEVVAVERVGLARPQVFGPIAGDDNPSCALSFETGVTVSLQPLGFQHYRENGLHIWGERGRVDILNEGLTVLHYPLAGNRAMTGEREIACDAPVALAPTVGMAFYRMYDNLADALVSPEPAAALWSGGHSAMETSRIVDAIRLAPVTGARVWTGAPARSRGVVFVEDPGAVNWIAPLAAALGRAGTPPLVLSAGLATPLLQHRGLHPVVVDAADAVARLRSAEARWLVVGTSENPDSAAFDLVAAARGAGVPSLGLVDFAANAGFRFRGRTDDPLAHVPDLVCVGDDFTAGEFVTLGMPTDRVRVVGRPQQEHLTQAADRLRAEGRDAVRRRVLPPDAQARCVVVFVSEISTGLNPGQYRRAADYTLHGRGHHDGRTEIVVDEVLDAVAAAVSTGAARPFLVLRRHPKETADDLRDHVAGFDVESRGGDPLDLIFAADLVIGLSSQLLAEAHFLGVPTISVLPRVSERAWLPETRAGLVPSAVTRADLHRLVGSALRQTRDGVPQPAADTMETGSAVDRLVALLRTIETPSPVMKGAAVQ